jgi:hypothetical protein
MADILLTRVIERFLPVEPEQEPSLYFNYRESEQVLLCFSQFLEKENMQKISPILCRKHTQILFFREEDSSKVTISFNAYQDGDTDDEDTECEEYSLQVTKRKLRNILESLITLGRFYDVYEQDIL